MKPMDCRVRPGNDDGEYSTMKIASVECLPVHSGWRKNFVFVRVETDSGIVGWGEAYSQYDRDRAIASQVEELGRYVVGRDPFQVRHILQIDRRAHV